MRGAARGGMRGAASALFLLAHAALGSEEGGPTDTRFQKDTFVRVQADGGKRVIVVAEQEKLVHLVLSATGTVLDCQARRRQYEVLGQLMAEVEQYEESGEWPAGIEFIELETDVGWYGRQCRRQQRDQLRAAALGESSLPATELEELMGRAWLQGRVHGTKFCSRVPPSVLLEEENLGEEREMDQCCLSLYSCSDPLSPLEHRHGLLNPSLFPLFPCPCLAAALSCLRAVGSEEAVRLARVWGDYGGHCYTLQERVASCTKHDTWFASCLEGNFTEVAVRRHVLDAE